MRRRSFLKLLAAAVAVAAVDPVVMVSALEHAPVVAPPFVGPLVGIAAYDLLPPALMIYPVYTPLRNLLPRVAA